MSRYSTMLWLSLLAWSIGLTQATAEPPAPAATVTVDQSPERLGEMLKALGYAVVPIRDATGGFVGFQAETTLERTDGAVRLVIRAMLTADKSTVWLKLRLSQVTDLDGVPPAVFVKLLAANRGISPAFFVYEETDGASDLQTCTLYLYLPVNAASLTPSVLHEQLDFLISKMLRTRSLWDTTLWSTVAPKAAS